MTGASSPPRVGVAVITHNRRERLLETIAHLVALPECPPIVVVDNNSTDGSARAVSTAFPGVTLLRSDKNLGAAGRNLAVDYLQTPYVAFADDDTWWEPGALSAAADLFDSHPVVGVITARIIVEPAGVVDAICEEMAESPLPLRPGLPGHALLSFLAGASVVRRDAYRSVGGFDHRLFLGGEEEHLAADLACAGWSMIYVPELAVHHYPGARDAHRRRRYGIRNTLWFAWSRRSWDSALLRTFRLVRSLPRDRVSAYGLLDAARGLPTILHRRQPVPASVEAGYRLLDRQQMNSKARRYVS